MSHILNACEITVACTLVQSFRLFVPDMPPFCQDGENQTSVATVFEILNFLIDQVPLVNDEEVAPKAWYMVEYIAELKLFNCVFE